MRLNILGTGSAIPARAVTNDELAAFLDTSDEWITTRTGIRSRRVATDETVLSLGTDAGRRAMADAGIAPDDIDYLLCSTVQADTVTPSLACPLQASLNLNCPAVDLNGACAGFLYALDLADALIASGKARRVLIVCSEVMSRLCDWTDRSTAVLFGDGAGAVVVGPGDALKAMRLTSEGDEHVLYAVPDPGNCPFALSPRAAKRLVMLGSDVYKFAVSHSLHDLRAVMEKAGLEADNVDHYILHQANQRIVDAVRQRLHQREDKFPVNVDERGNTSSASVPILLDELRRAGRLKPGDTLALSAFGAGLTTGACIITWTKD